MKEGEIKDIKKNYPFVAVVLRMIENGESITQDSHLWLSYLLARQRGFVERTGSDGNTIVVSERGKEFLRRK